MGITYGDHLIDSGYYDITPEQEREIEAREECARRGIDPDEICADGGVEVQPDQFGFKADAVIFLTDLIEAQAAELERVKAELARAAKEPPLTCPAIDALVAKHSPDADVVTELAHIRDINSNLRYGLWHWMNRAEAAESALSERTRALEMVRAGTLNECADLIEKHSEGHLTGSGKRVLIERSHASVDGLGYAHAIRALSAPNQGGQDA